jgi:hypothetical protein
LRVTEQDVVNEEMYEEEDEDLPLQYRRLTAHLQTGSAEFNRRLAAYLSSQVAMRSMQFQNPYGQYNYNGPYEQPNQNMFPSPMLPLRPNTGRSTPSASYRPSPYPPPRSGDFRSNHGRAFSVAGLPNHQGSSTTSPPPHDHRRMSTPANLQSGDVKPDPEYQRHTEYSNSAAQSPFPMWPNMGPFTTSLPPESQQLLAHAPGFDTNDPTYAALMHGSDQYVSDPYYSWEGVYGGIKGMPVHPSAYKGMSATLAPSVLDQRPAGGKASISSDDSSTPSVPAHSNGPVTPPATVAPDNCLPHTTGLDFIHFSPESKQGMDLSFTRMGSASGSVTPAAEGYWEHFVMDGSWDDNADLRAHVSAEHPPGADNETSPY